MKRNTVLDIVSGLFIIEIILLHISYLLHLNKEYLSIFWNRFLFFYMPWFYFKSGYFFRPTSPNQEIRKSSKKLIIPFCFFTIISIIFVTPFMMLNHPEWSILGVPFREIKNIFWSGAPSDNTPLWFLLSLFYVKVIYAAIYNYLRRYLSFICFVISPILGFILSIFSKSEDPFTFLGFTTCFNALFFYALGAKLSEKNLENSKTIAVVLIYLIVIAIYPSRVDMRTNVLENGNYFLWLISAIGGLLTILIAFRYLHSKWLFRMSLLSYIGKNSMIYFVLHWPIIYAFRYAWREIGIDNLLIETIIISFILIISLPLLDKFLRRYCGKLIGAA